jgi:hypothetical protein
MQTIIDFWAMANTLVIMFALGLHHDSATTERFSVWLYARVSMYNLIFPAILLVVLQQMALFSTASLSAMALCIRRWYIGRGFC